MGSIPDHNIVVAGSKIREVACRLPAAASVDCILIDTVSSLRIGNCNRTIIGAVTGNIGTANCSCKLIRLGDHKRRIKNDLACYISRIPYSYIIGSGSQTGESTRCLPR